MSGRVAPADPRTWSLPIPVADDLWLIAHDDYSGRPRLRPAALRIALAGALLGEMVLSGHVLARAGHVITCGAAAPADAAVHTVWEQMCVEPQHDLRTWVRYVAHDAEALVVARLVRSGLVVEGRQRHLLRTSTVYLPAEVNYAFWRPTRLRDLLARSAREQPGWAEVLLGALVEVTGLVPLVWPDDAAPAVAFLRRALPAADESLREVVGVVHTLLGDAVLSAGH